AAAGSIVAGDRFVFLSGRYSALFQAAVALRAVDKTNTNLLYNPNLETIYHVADARGIALGTNQRTVYVVGRSPETLLIASIDGTDPPSFRLRRAVPLPSGADQIAVLNRSDGTDLIAISCTADGDFVLYDERVGRLVADIPGTGQQPYAMAVDKRTLPDGR